MAFTNPPIATAAATATATAAAAAAHHLFLHPVPKPITFLEFFDAIRAATPPRFPHARTAQPRRIGLAVSGGVDSMALAYLFNQLREINPLMRVVDNPLAKISAYVIDHGLREGSREEALAVVKELRNFKHIRPQSEAVNWKAEGVTGDPNLLPNVESLARRVRYRRLGTLCLAMHVESIFLAHHQDDQYETVLMRLLAGHGSRGLRGMLKAGNIPECYDMHGVYESGHVDDQMMRIPQISFRPPKRDWRHMRRQLVSELDLELYGAELRAGLQTGWHEGPYVGGGGEDDSSGSDWLFSAASSASAKARAAAAARNMTRIRTEEAGVMIYRPLLEFSKDRLIATCEANNVRWFEDATNKDVTLTTRNAVRHMVRNHNLPAALRKENVLRMSARCGAKLRGLEREAERWIKRQVIAEFEPNVGTLVVRLPELGVFGPGPGQGRGRGRKSVNDGVRRELRLAHRRAVAGFVVKRLVAFVSPDRNPPQHTSLQNIVAKLFPTLVEDSPSSSASVPMAPPKAFNQASVLFLPLAPSKWYLVREPYPSLHPHPQTTYTTTSNISDKHRHPTFPPTQWECAEDAEYMSRERLALLDRMPLPQPKFRETRRWYAWRRFKLWDGRFWIRVRGRVKAYFRIAPFAPIHGKAFREGLGGGGEAGGAADAVEREQQESKEEGEIQAAPGIGVTGGRGSSTNTTMSAADRRAEFEGILKRFAPGKVRYTLPALYAVNRDEQTGEEVLRMLALPTLGVGLPGLERWVQYEVRYRKVDMGLFERETVGRGSRGGGWGRMPQRRGGRSDGGSGRGSGSGGRSQSSGAFVGGAVLRRHVLADGTAEERAWKRISGIRRRKRMMTAVVVRNKKKQEEE